MACGNPLRGDKKRYTGVCKGSEVGGWACKAMPEAPVLFNTRALRAPLPWAGEQWHVIFYSAAGLLHCTPTWRRQLVNLGFRLPNVV